MRSGNACNWLFEFFNGEIDECRPVLVRNRNDVDGYVDASDFFDHRVSVFLNRLGVEGVDQNRLGDPSSGRYLLSQVIDRWPGETGEEDLRALTGEGPSNRSADCPARSVDDGVFIFQQHLALVVSVRRTSRSRSGTVVSVFVAIN